jgi:diguanylate cyclase (GGDEF)-like protein
VYPAGCRSHEDAMKDPSDTRDIGPRIGSPLWIYLTLITVAGLGALLAALLRELPAAGLRGLAGQQQFWVLAALSVLGELRPIVTPGKSRPDAGVASVTFCFAALLYWGLAVAAGLLAVSTLFVALSRRKAPFRCAFNVAQLTLSLAAAAAVLAIGGIQPRPLRPWVPTGGALGTVGLAALAYFTVNFLLVGMAVTLYQRTPLPVTLRRNLPYQALVSLALLSAAPLVVVAMSRSVLLVLLFLLPLIAVYANAAIAMQREHQARHDQLTGLPNRAMLFDRAGEAVAEAARTGSKTGFLLLDLDRFKEVNDTFGHQLGDGLLQAVAYRLARSVRPGDVVARLGGDEFAVLLPAVRATSAAREVAARLRAALAEPVRLEGMSFEINASVGIALYPDDAGSVEQLLQHADVAMYLAKERRTGVERYAGPAGGHFPARLSLLGDLRRGIDHGEFELYYQPTVLLAGGRTAGMEALLRWQHPSRGRIGPAEFIPLAEQSFIMHDLTAYVIRAALGQAAAWRLRGLPVQLSVNVSVRDLLDAGLAGRVEGELAALGLPPEVLLIEVSDRALTSEAIDIAAGVSVLRGLGVRLSLDDFGTGYASLARLRRMPVAEVKIAPTFVSGLASSPDSQVIVRSLVDMVRGLGIRSVAEGVETADVAAALLAIGCDAAQGYAFSRPLNAAAATRWLAGDLAVHQAPAARREPPAQPAAAAPAPVTSAAAPESPGG